MLKILCFGDSNAFGYNPSDGSRYNDKTRWSALLKDFLFKEKIDLVELGKCNRTTFKNVFGKEESGDFALEKYFKNSNLEDISGIIFQIGINDVQKIYNAKNDELKNGILKLIQLSKKYLNNPKILLILPLEIEPQILKTHFSELFDETSIEKSKILASIYLKIAQEENVEALDLSEIAEVSKIDGLHFNETNHKKIFSAVKDKLSSLL